MKKYKVLREMPFAKVGEIIEIEHLSFMPNEYCTHELYPTQLDVEALAKIIAHHRGGHPSDNPAGWDYNFAKHIVANLDKWLVEKNEKN